MNVLEIISGAMLLLTSICIIVSQLLQETKNPGLSQSIGGGMNDSFFEKNSGRTREAKMKRITTVLAVIFFVLALVVNVISNMA